MRSAYQLHDEARGHIDRDTLQRIGDHQPAIDLVHGERLQAVFQWTKPLEPSKHRWDVLQMHEEARERHLVQPSERTQEDSDASVSE